jgi:hypothetical protein
MAREILAELRKHFEDKMFKTIVNFNTKIKEAASLGQPINEYDPASKGQKDFHGLAEEIVGSVIKPQRREFVNSLASQLEAISATADELLESASPTIEAVRTAKTEQSEPLDIDAKLSDYYGVSQIDGAVVLVTLYPRADSVLVAGDFNNWQPTETPMQKVDDGGVWQTKLKLPAGKYRYRLVVDGQWQQDPYNGWTELNPYGDFNSVLEVK